MRIHYLTWIRNRLGRTEEQIDLPANVSTVADLLDFLEAKDENYKKVFSSRSVIFSSVNGSLCPHGHTIKNSDQISFFSAIVGG